MEDEAEPVFLLIYLSLYLWYMVNSNHFLLQSKSVLSLLVEYSWSDSHPDIVRFLKLIIIFEYGYAMTKGIMGCLKLMVYYQNINGSSPLDGMQEPCNPIWLYT